MKTLWFNIRYALISLRIWMARTYYCVFLRRCQWYGCDERAYTEIQISGSYPEKFHFCMQHADEAMRTRILTLR